MFIIWGSKHFSKKLSAHGNYCCENCNNNTPFDFVRHSKWFSLFFIPIFPFSSKYYLLCPICQCGYKLNSKQVAELKQGINPQDTTY